jgi:uncharacterized protein (TIGR03084 family)
MSDAPDVFDALAAEQDAIEHMLSPLGHEWDRDSTCPGWSVSDVVLHLAQTEEAVVAVLQDDAAELANRAQGTNSVDAMMDKWVRDERGAPSSEVLARWSDARRRAMEALRAADPQKPISWAAVPLKPRTLATTRLSEHWIHALDIAEPLRLDHPDTDRLWHVARLAHRTLPFAFAVAGRPEPPSVFLDLASPGGSQWRFGPDDAGCRVSGSAGDFCRVAARRRAPDSVSLEASGDRAGEVLELVRTYA